MSGFVLSLFPGGGFLDSCFEAEGFTLVRGPEWIFGQDIRNFHPPRGKFDGIIGGDPCQSHSALANLVRAKGLEPSFPDMTPEFERVIDEARPRWFLRENVPKAPELKPPGYAVRSFLLDNCTSFGEVQQRRRRFWFGVWGDTCPELRKYMEFALDVPPVEERQMGVTQRADSGRGDVLERRQEREQTVAASSRAVPVALGGSGKRKRTAPVTGRNEGAVGAPGKDYSPPKRSLEDMLELQGYPTDYFGDAKRNPFKMTACRKMAGNAVARPTGIQLARAIRKAMS